MTIVNFYNMDRYWFSEPASH